jgi:O-antigen/teichoic acid export membrane protein
VSSTERQLVTRGLTWNLLFQVFQIGLNFLAMMLLARIIPPVEYGRVAAALGFLSLLNAFNCGMFMAHALQLPAGEEPDWSAHFSAGLYLQSALALVTVGVSLALLASPAHRSVSGLLLIAAAGLMVDWPGQLRQAMLRRALDFRRLRVLSACSLLASLATTVTGGLLGWGASAIVLGANVVTALPFAVDLLLVHRFSPRKTWWRGPDWRAYRPAMKFGLQQASSTMLNAARGAMASAVLPGTLGLAVLGLFSRAQALYTNTGARGVAVLVETVYPLLPRHAPDRVKFARYATIFARTVLWVAMPAVTIVSFAGSDLSRVLYGTKWVDADPFIAPMAVAGLGLSIVTIGSSVLLAVGRLRACVILDVIGTVLAAPAVLATLLGGDARTYVWLLMAGQLVSALIYLLAAAPLLEPGSWVITLAPPIVANALGAAAMLGISHWPPLHALGPLPRLVIMGAGHALIVLGSLRLLFPKALADMLGYVAGGRHVKAVLRLGT